MMRRGQTPRWLSRPLQHRAMVRASPPSKPEGPMADKPVIATVRETRESPFSVEVVVDGHEIESDEPVDSGGKNLGPYPHEILVAALGACTAQTVRWYAARHNWPLDSVEVDVTYKKE